MSPEEIGALLETHISKGLSSESARLRLEKEGKNLLPKKGSVSPLRLLLSQFGSLIVLLLIGASLVAGLLGEVVDAIAIISIVLFNVLLGFFQEFRAEKSLLALQKLILPVSQVIREGVLTEIPSEDVVPGDLLYLEPGRAISADGRILSASHLRVDEAALTGESVPVTKQVAPLERGVPLADRTNMVFLGTVVTTGKGVVLVTSTGMNTEMGKIATQISETKREQTPLQKKLDALGKRLVYVCLALIGIVFTLGLLRGEKVIEMLLISLSLAVAAIPEGLPAAVTIALSIGVRKMAEKKALIRRLSSVETLGATTVICCDKTGTLTQNAMTVRALWVGGSVYEVSGAGYAPIGAFTKEGKSIEVDQERDLLLALKVGALCNSARIEKVEGQYKVIGDPTEGALITLAKKGNIDLLQAEREEPLLEEIPFDSTRKMMSMLRGGNQQTLYVKGAPDLILSRCPSMLVNGKEVPLDRERILQANQSFAKKALRVLALGLKRGGGNEEENLLFIGLVAMMDPPREEANQAVETCRRAGIRTVMVTGDHKETASAIGKEVGLLSMGGISIDGSELDAMNEEEFLQAVENVELFSRIHAGHKLRIISALQQKGEIVAMTGDGVNDAPAVQKANIGISMGITGTDVTKSASDMVILDDNFQTIVGAVEQGRGIYDNIVKFISYLLSSNLAEILVLFLVLLIGMKGPAGEPLVALLPVQLLWMNLITDGFPAISLAMDPVEAGAMTRPPRQAKEEILHFRFSLLICLVALLVTAGALIGCWYGAKTSVLKAQTMTFTTLIVLELIRAQMIRREYKLSLFSNWSLVWALSSSFLLQLGVIYLPFCQKIFQTVPLSFYDWGVIGLIALGTWCLGIALTSLSFWVYRK